MNADEMWQAVVDGEVDAMLSAWLPVSQSLFFGFMPIKTCILMKMPCAYQAEQVAYRKLAAVRVLKWFNFTR
jgi:hypothetical protein